MTTTKKKKVIPQRAGLLIKSPEKFVTLCRNNLNKCFPGHSFGFNNTYGSGNTEIFTLSSPNVSRAEAKYSYSVVPILRSLSSFFWITVVLVFENESAKDYLLSVSILLFEGNHIDRKKTPLLRAEWDCPKENPDHHAQPHWHVYPIQLNQFQPGFDDSIKTEDFVPPNLQKEEQQSPIIPDYQLGWKNCEKFHFAMASKWHLEGLNAHKEPFQEDWVLNWINGCVVYIYNQLVYLNGKDKIKE